MNKIMELQTGVEITLGDTVMTGDPRENRSVPEWIEQTVLPRAREDAKPLLDIYAEVLRLREDVAALTELVHTQHAAVREDIREIPHLISLPWDIRVRRWLRRLFGKEV